MCGIIGVTNRQKAAQKQLLHGLYQMEYRGYDSAGVTFHQNFNTYKSITGLKQLDKATQHIEDPTGLAHTRWATHGEVSTKNAHPINIKNYVIVHNGIIENTDYILSETNYKPKTQTDTELLLAYFIHIMETHSLSETFKKIEKNIKGSYATAILEHENKKIIWMKKGFSPLSIVETEDGYIITSDAESVKDVKKIYEINTDGYGYITPDEMQIYKGEYQIKTQIKKIQESTHENYKTWLEKEIHEQLNIYEKEEAIILKHDFTQYSNIKLIGCGSSYFAAQLGEQWLEEKNIVSKAYIASEWTNATTLNQPNQLAIFISQSGFTADTLSALLKAKENHSTLSLVNNDNSPISQQAENYINLNAGIEKSVASSKAFSSQIIKLYQLIYGQLPEEISKKIANMLKLNIEGPAKQLTQAENIFILGKDKLNIIAKEGMLKLTEITYLNVFAYPAGELKHGYISKITENSYAIMLAPENPILLRKITSSAQEIITRKGKIIWIGSTNPTNTPYFIKTESINDTEALFCYPIILQRLALRVAELLNREIDKPRNLAKSVTVE